MNFNARSICNKFVEISIEIKAVGARIVCITETWVTSIANKQPYKLDGYDSYFNCKKDKTGDGVVVLAGCSLPAVQLTPEITPNDAFNVCVISLDCQRTKSLIAVIYRAPWADYGDTKALFVHLENICARNTVQLIIVDYFNLSSMVWSNVSPSTDSPTESLLPRFMYEHMLTQLAYELTNQSALLDLIFVSPGLIKSCITNLPPVCSSDHSAQMLTLYSTLNYNAKLKNQFTVYQILDKLLIQIDWVNEYAWCSSEDDFTQCLYCDFPRCY